MSETVWMTRHEAAAHLRISMRQLDRLRLPRSVLGASPRYARHVLDDHLAGRMVTPGQSKRGGSSPPLRFVPPRSEPLDVKAELRKVRRRLRY